MLALAVPRQGFCNAGTCDCVGHFGGADCTPGYFGHDCRAAYSDDDTCHGHGTCSSAGMCVCEAGDDPDPAGW